MRNKKQNETLEHSMHHSHESYVFKDYLKKIPFLFNFSKSTYIFLLHIISKNRWKKILLSSEVKLNLGSGSTKGKNGWVNVDLFGADINHDLIKGVPLDDNTVDVVYSSHVFEHIPYKNLLHVIKEIRRILKPGGKLLVCVPNAGLYLRAYFNNEMFVNYDEMYIPAVVNTNSKIDQLNYIAYLNGDHTFMFDEENIVNILKMCDFNSVDFRDYDAEIDHQDRDFESMYVQAFK
jgi:predicted SAM-dependent methyltransferase